MLGLFVFSRGASPSPSLRRTGPGQPTTACGRGMSPCQYPMQFSSPVSGGQCVGGGRPPFPRPAHCVGGSGEDSRGV